MKIQLISLILKNFKGIKEFELKANGNVDVLGDNGTGKTTLYDAFLWLLFDKDSNNKKDFNIKTLDKNGQVIHFLEHEVEGILSVDSQPLKLKKMLSEKWVKKRGDSEKEFSGHETLYWIDEVPVKRSEYLEKIASLVSENVFKLITNPLFFNTQLTWQDRRKTLMEVCGGVTNNEVITSNQKLHRLTEILGNRTIDDYKKVLAEQVKRINSEIEKIPTRIDELHKSMPETGDYTELEIELQKYKSELVATEDRLLNIAEVNRKAMQKQRELMGYKNDLQALYIRIEHDANKDRNKIVDEKEVLQTRILDAESEIRSAKKCVESYKTIIESKIKRKEELYKLWNEAIGMRFTEPTEDEFICPTCKQDIPIDQKNTRLSKIKSIFLDDIGRKKDAINKEGKAIKLEVEKLESNIANLEKIIESSEGIANETRIKVEEMQSILSNEPATIDFGSNTEVINLRAKIKDLECEFTEPIEGVATDLMAKKYTIIAEVEQINKALNNKEVAEKTKLRIEELQTEQKKLGIQLSELEGHKFLLEEFVKTKVDMLEGSINAKFKNVKFKLFDTQINGGVVECCETLINTNGAWVGFADANNAGKINAGLDIINTLSEFHGANAPIWIDNREGVTKLTQINSQLINLFVSESDKKLRIMEEI